MWKKWLQISLWCLLGCGCIVLFVAAIQVKDGKTCSDVQIAIDDKGERIFVDEKDVQKILTDHKAVKGAATESIHLGAVESELEKNAWVKDAQLFFDNNQVLTVKIEERQPLARVFTTQGTSFYIDSSATKLPLSDKFSAKVPVFTSFPSDKKTLPGADSAILQDVKHIAQYVQQDSFWMAQVAQVDITQQHTFEIIPVLGNQVIVLGSADELDKKFKKLFAFYKQVWSKTGFEKYEKIDLQYEGEVVAVKRGVILPPTDSALAQQYGGGFGSLSNATSDTLYAGVQTREPKPVRDSSVSRRPKPPTTAVLHAPAKRAVPPKRGKPAPKRGGKPITQRH